MKCKVLFITILAVTAVALGAFRGPAATTDPFAAGLSEFNSGAWQAAADLLASAAKQKPTDAVRRIAAGVALANVKLYEAAAEHFEAASKLAPDAALPRMLYEATCSEIGKAKGGAPVAPRPATGPALKRLSPPAGQDRLTRALTQSLLAYPNNAIAQCLLGDIAQLQGDLAAAKEHYAAASRLAPKWPKPVFNMGIADLTTDPKAAEAELSQAANMDPTNLRTYLWLGDAQLRQGNYGKALQTYKKAESDPSLAAEARMRIGNGQMQAGNYSIANEQFDMAAQQAPGDPRPIAGQAQTLQKMGKPKEAERKYSEAAQIVQSGDGDPTSQAYLQSQIATVQEEQGKYSQAASNYALGFELHPTRAYADALASAQQKAGTLGINATQNELALKKNPDSVPTMIYLLSTYRISGNAQATVDMATRLVKADPANASTYYRDIGAARVMLGQTDDAVDAFCRSFELGNALTWPDTVNSAARCGVLGLVQKRYEAAFAAKPDRAKGAILMETQQAMGDTNGVVATARKLVEMYSDDAVLWLRLGEAHECAGDKEAAESAYTRAAAGSNAEAASLAKARLAEIKGK